MAFDLSTAKPVGSSGGGFDLSTAKPYQPETQPERKTGVYGAQLNAESGGRDFDKNGELLRSPKWALGSRQVLMSTALYPGLPGVTPIDRNVVASGDKQAIARELNRVGDEYMEALRKRYNGNEELALAAYNAGFGAVDKAGGKVPNFPETRAYVEKILGPKLGGAVVRAAEEVTQPLPDNDIFSKEYWTQNVPRSFARFPAALAYGTGSMLYDAAKNFTDPVMKLIGGEQSLPSAAYDFVMAPSTAGRNMLAGIGETIAAPLGFMGADAANASWNDPAAALAGAYPALKMARTGTSAAVRPRVISAAEKLMDSSLKQPTTLPRYKREQNVTTALEGGYQPSYKGLDKLTADIKTNEGRVASGIASGDSAGRAGTLDRAIANIEALREQARRSSDPAGNVALIDAEIEALRNNPMLNESGQIPVGDLQKMKVEQGREIAKSYGEQKPQFQNAIDKARVRGLKEELEIQLFKEFPELMSVNKKLGEQYQLEKVLERAANRIENREGLGFTPFVKTGAAAGIGSVFGTTGAMIGTGLGTMAAIIEHPTVAPKIAIALHRAAKGKLTMPEAQAMVNERLTNMTRAMQDGEQSWQAYLQSREARNNPVTVDSPVTP